MASPLVESGQNTSTPVISLWQTELKKGTSVWPGVRRRTWPVTFGQSHSKEPCSSDFETWSWGSCLTPNPGELKRKRRVQSTVRPRVEEQSLGRRSALEIYDLDPHLIRFLKRTGFTIHVKQHPRQEGCLLLTLLLSLEYKATVTLDIIIV